MIKIRVSYPGYRERVLWAAAVPVEGQSLIIVNGPTVKVTSVRLYGFDSEADAEYDGVLAMVEGE